MPKGQTLSGLPLADAFRKRKYSGIACVVVIRYCKGPVKSEDGTLYEIAISGTISKR
jgi:hypothetical protein